MVDSTNGVGAGQEVRYLQQNGVNAPQTNGEMLPNSVNEQQVNTRGKGTEVQTQTDFNTFGKDIENFDNFKGNDKYDAMRMTQTAANDVKKAYMQLQHEFPDAYIPFEAMPDPKTCGKKREGFFNYQQQLNDWKDIALTQIANARETTTQEGFDDVNANVNRNAAMNAGVTIAMGETIMANDDVNAAILSQKGDDIENAVHKEGAATRNTVRKEGQQIQDEIRQQGAATRNTVRDEGAATRNTVRREHVETRNTVRAEAYETKNNTNEKAKQTQILNGISDKITTVLNGFVTPENAKNISNLRNKILQSGVNFETKKELMTHLASFSTQSVINAIELRKEQQYINNKLVNAAPDYDRGVPTEFPPDKEFPKHEFPPEPAGTNKPKIGPHGEATKSEQGAGPNKKHPMSSEDKPLPKEPNDPEKDFDSNKKPSNESPALPEENFPKKPKIFENFKRQ